MSDLLSEMESDSFTPSDLPDNSELQDVSSIAEKVQQKWNEEFNIPINVVLGNEWNAGNLSYHLDSRPVWEGFVNDNKLDKLNKYICIDEICVGNR